MENATTETAQHGGVKGHRGSVLRDRTSCQGVDTSVNCKLDES